RRRAGMPTSRRTTVVAMRCWARTAGYVQPNRPRDRASTRRSIWLRKNTVRQPPDHASANAARGHREECERLRASRGRRQHWGIASLNPGVPGVAALGLGGAQTFAKGLEVGGERQAIGVFEALVAELAGDAQPQGAAEGDGEVAA